MNSTTIITVRRAGPDDAALIGAILLEANTWLHGRGERLWTAAEIGAERIERDVAEEIFYIAECGGEAAGTLRLELSDIGTWPEVRQEDAAYVHRLAVRRKFAGRHVARSMLAWAAEQARAMERPLVRLDCEAHRPKLRAFYESAGFTFHSECVVEGCLLARYEQRV